MTIHEKLSHLRAKRSLTQVEASNGIGISCSSLKNYENDRIPETPALQKIQKFYDVPIEYLVNDECINEEYSNVDIGKVLSLSDKSIEQIKAINNSCKTHVIDNFISCISKNEFWKRLDNCKELSKEIKTLLPLLNKAQKIKSVLYLYATKDDFMDYMISENDNSFEIDYNSFYKKNHCKYNLEDKVKILDFIDLLTSNKILIEPFSDGNVYIDIAYNYVADDIKSCILNNAFMPLSCVDVILNIPQKEIDNRTNKIDIDGFYISQEVTQYIKNM